MLLTNPSIAIMVLDDHAVVRLGLETALAPDPSISIVGSFSTSGELIRALQVTKVDLIVLDYSLGADDADGLNLVRMLRLRYPKIKIIIYSMHDQPVIVSLLLRAGANGFFAKGEDISGLGEVIHRIVAGKNYALPEYSNIASELGEISTSTPVVEDGAAAILAHKKLTPKEHEVLRCYLDGMSVIQIAEKYSRSRKTVSGQKQSAYRKLGISTANELFKIRHILDSY